MQSDPGASSFTKMCATIGSLVNVLLTLLQVKYENKDASPFDTDGLVMMLFIVTMLINTLVAVATVTVQAWFTNHSLIPVLNQICIAFGVLACDLLLLILAPSFGYFFLVIWVLLLFLVLLYYVFTLALHNHLRNWAVYNKVQKFYQKCMVRCPLFHAAPQASAASTMAQTSVEQQDEFSEISNDMNV